MHRRTAFIASAAFAFATLTLVASADAQPSGRGGPGWGPGMMDRGMMGRMCGPSAAGFAEWRMDRLERVIKPTEAQRAKFDEFKTASAKATEIMRAACPTEIPLTMTGRMAMMEKRSEAMLQAIKTVRPTLDALYATLNDEQKADIDSNTGRHRFWRWRRHW
ncbi:MAG: Spy/CpxP family protein refolding chaperone [Xanthobacteraceae bacterium]